MNTLSFNVEITFADKLVDDQAIKDVRDNLLKAIVHATETSGIAPELSDTYTTKIMITPKHLEEETITLEII